MPEPRRFKYQRQIDETMETTKRLNLVLQVIGQDAKAVIYAEH